MIPVSSIDMLQIFHFLSFDIDPDYCYLLYVSRCRGFLGKKMFAR